MKKPRSITVKTGTAHDFMENVKHVMREADKGRAIKSSYTLTFEEPADMLHFLTETKMKLIRTIRKHPDSSITELAKLTKRNRVAIDRDICEMEEFGLLESREDINPGHGKHRIVTMTASKLHLEAYI